MIKKISDYRREIKFFVQGLHSDIVRPYIWLNQARFSKEYPNRYVNNIYFDSLTMQNLYDNIDGISERNKLRFRWYGKLLRCEKGVLEIKRKRNQLGNKISYSIPQGFTFLKTSWREIIRSIHLHIGDSSVLFHHLFHPVLINRYQREYYINSDKDIRLTFDTRIQYFSQYAYFKPNMKQSAFIQPHSIIEIKMNACHEEKLSRLIHQFPFRVTKSSKYVTGVQSCIRNHLWTV